MAKWRYLKLLLVLGLILVMAVIPTVFAADYTSGVTASGSSAVKIWFKPSGWTAGYVILHYTVAGGAQENVYMSYNSAGGQWEKTISNLTSGARITYSYTYNRDGLQYDTASATYTVGSGNSGGSGKYMYNTLVWSDEFNGDSLNRSNWNYQIGNGYNNGSGGFDGWGNGEWEWYRPENVSVAGGNLIIKAEYLSTPYVFANRNWYQFSGRITTKGLRSWQYGRVEARIKVPAVRGTWPAFWMMGDVCDTTVNGAAGGYDVLPSNWSSCGEIDIMEQRNAENQICSNLFWDTRTGLYPWAAETNANNPTWTQNIDQSQWHVYAMEWNGAIMNYYVDGNLIKTQDISGANQEEFRRPFFIILNLAISGTFTGPTEPNKADFPCTMNVDYVRVYQ